MLCTSDVQQSCNTIEVSFPFSGVPHQVVDMSISGMNVDTPLDLQRLGWAGVIVEDMAVS
jgi:hypothetical protein